MINSDRSMVADCRKCHHALAAKTAKGIIFLSNEDDTGIPNAVVMPDVFDANPIVIISSS
jgi:hypothetical protein